MIKNWKLFLESSWSNHIKNLRLNSKSDLELIEDVMSEFEDEFSISIKYDEFEEGVPAVYDHFRVIHLEPNQDTSNIENAKMVKSLSSICDKIHNLTNDKYFCMFKLTFINKQHKNKSITIISDEIESKENNLFYQKNSITSRGSTRIESGKFKKWDSQIFEISVRDLSNHNFVYGYVWINER